MYAHQLCNVPYQPCSQRQGMHAAVLPPPVALLASMWHDAEAERRAAQEKANSDVNATYRLAVMRDPSYDRACAQ